MHLYLLLFYEFFKIGLFAIGGGYATLPFLYHLGHQYGWYSAKELSQMIAVSCITPGPVGINVATYTGFKTASIIGSFITTFSIMLPSFILIVIISKALNKFKDNIWIKASIYALKPVSCGMIAAIGFKLLKHAIYPANIDIYALILFIILLIISFKSKKNPLFYLSISGLTGILLYLLKNIF